MKKLVFTLLVGIALFLVSCSRNSKQAADDSSIVPAMRQTYDDVSELYYYSWDEEKFFKKTSEKKIKQLLENLSRDFNNIENSAHERIDQPGFRITLSAQQELIEELRKQFNKGNKDYVHWRLRGLAQNCISCHTQKSAVTSFYTTMPKDNRDKDSFESKSAQAEFKLATRQFKAASRDFLNLAKDLIEDNSEEIKISYALKHWLLIQVRVLKDKKTTLGEIATLIKELGNDPGLKEVLLSWQADLITLDLTNDIKTGSCLKQTEEYLKPYNKMLTFKTLEERLAKTLHVSSCLHQALAMNPTEQVRKKASFLLAVTYDRMPISFYELNRELYLEQVIKEYPKTFEAQIAFELFQERILAGNTGSGGLHLDSDQLDRLNKLRKLAYGHELQIDDSKEATFW